MINAKDKCFPSHIAYQLVSYRSYINICSYALGSCVKLSVNVTSESSSVLSGSHAVWWDVRTLEASSKQVSISIGLQLLTEKSIININISIYLVF